MNKNTNQANERESSQLHNDNRDGFKARITLISKLRFFVIPYVLIGVGNDLIDKSLHFVCKIDRLKFKYATDCAGHLNAKFEARPYLQTQTRPNG